MYVFRDGRKTLLGERLVSGLREALQRVARGVASERDNVVNALIAAGELECSLADASSPQLDEAARLTDALAEMLVGLRGNATAEILSALEGIHPPAEARISVHEGFAYYALHPMKVVDLLPSLAPTGEAAVIGIRSIGVTLSAILAAGLKKRGLSADRITVRPTGHPYDRRLTLADEQKAWIEQRSRREFMIIDEGPGLSGSSFLAAAEALERSGIPAERIRMIGSRQPEVSQLRSPNAAERWPRFRFACMASHPYVPEGAVISIGGGAWRREFPAESREQPASWTQLEMAKLLSADRRLFYKFEGFGHFGGEIGRRSLALAVSGLGPRYLGNQEGFGIYEIARGRMLGPGDLSPVLLRHIARYCAFRLREFAADDAQPSAIDQMLRWNWTLEFGAASEFGGVAGFAVDDATGEFGKTAPAAESEPEHRIFCDARMMPHEWLELPDGQLFKLDGVAHGDDHFFPGPCDIAWDLAGTIVEWKLDGAARECFLDEYRRASGDNPAKRLPTYLKAYLAFRFGWCKMAAVASQGSFDEALLWRDFNRYRAGAAALASSGRHRLPLDEGRNNPPLVQPQTTLDTAQE